ncbi:hypothetical protein ACJX0J_039186, partial [Zea mays]
FKFGKPHGSKTSDADNQIGELAVEGNFFFLGTFSDRSLSIMFFSRFPKLLSDVLRSKRRKLEINYVWGTFFLRFFRLTPLCFIRFVYVRFIINRIFFALH